MPYSDPANKTWTMEAIGRLNLVGDPVTVLDVGTGAGVYADMLRNSYEHDVHITGIEAWHAYYDRFGLLAKYDAMSLRDARWVTNWRYDLVIFGDVMEHMRKPDAIRMWDKAAGQAQYGIISIPIIHYPQGEEEGNPYERHVKDDWTVEEVLDSFKWIKETQVFDVTMVAVAHFPYTA